ncbi:MAG TPA: exosortase/archaeosortase family protein [Candidatus Thermoplasmatota archaeon]|nr:exosortase/archaeosortase family protein [Candidatus Thermoplasmatota archaeon]
MAPAAERARLVAGLLAAGYGLLSLTGVLDHETPAPLALVLVAVGLGLAAAPLARAARAPSPSKPLRRNLVLALGFFCFGSVLAYNLASGSAFSAPELALLAYGFALVALAPFLERRAGPLKVDTLVAYSLPLLLAPLAAWALQALLESGAGDSPLRWYLRHALVDPMAGTLSLLGIPASVRGETVALATDRGTLFLTVGVVCAGFYPAALFLGLLGLFAWERNLPPRRLALYALLGLAGVWLANVARLVLLAVVGREWGGRALQEAHQHAGWALFLAFTLAFWFLVLRRFEQPAAAGGGLSQTAKN